MILPGVLELLKAAKEQLTPHSSTATSDVDTSQAVPSMRKRYHRVGCLSQTPDNEIHVDQVHVTIDIRFLWTYRTHRGVQIWSCSYLFGNSTFLC